MKIVLSYFKVDMLTLLRNINALIFTIILPPILFLSFGQSITGDFLTQVVLVSAFANYAAQTVAFMSLGIQVSLERHSPWMLYLRTLPAHPSLRFMGTVLTIVVRSLVSITLLLGVGYAAGKINLSVAPLAYIVIVALLGAIPMGLLAIAFGNLLSPASARGFFVLTNMLLFLGTFVSSQLGWLCVLLPTYHWQGLVINHYTSQASVLVSWGCMALFTGIFYLFARWAYLRQRNIRFS